jgi:hypothetical protein
MCVCVCVCVCVCDLQSDACDITYQRLWCHRVSIMVLQSDGDGVTAALVRRGRTSPYCLLFLYSHQCFLLQSQTLVLLILVETEPMCACVCVCVCVCV